MRDIPTNRNKSGQDYGLTVNASALLMEGRNMVEIEASVSHQLGDEAALDRLHHMVDSLEQRFRDQVHCVQSHWDGNELDISFAAYGYKIQWHATVMADRIALVGRIPASARPYRGKIEQAIVARIEEIVQVANSQDAAQPRAA
jgi:hypothetical protein